VLVGVGRQGGRDLLSPRLEARLPSGNLNLIVCIITLAAYFLFLFHPYKQTQKVIYKSKDYMRT
jgi:hypothetical protein